MAERFIPSRLVVARKATATAQQRQPSQQGRLLQQQQIQKEIDKEQQRIDKEQQRIEENLKTQANQIIDKIKFADNKIKKYKKKRNSELTKFYEKYRKIYKKAYQDHKEGILFNIEDLDKYARAKSREVRRKETRAIAREQQPIKGRVTGINYSKGTAVVGGKTVRLTSDQLKNLKLTSVRKAETQNVLRKAQQGKSLNVKDFEIARQAGIKSSDLLNIARVRSSFDTEMKKAKRGVVPNISGLLRLGLSGREATNLAEAFEKSPQELEKIKEQSFNKLFEKITTKRGGVTIVDTITQERSYKTNINQILKNDGLREVPLNKSMKDFERAYKDYQDIKTLEIQKVIKAFTPNQRQQILLSFERTPDQEIPYLTKSDIDFLSKSKVKDLKTTKKLLAKRRKEQYEQRLIMPINIPGFAFTKIRNRNYFTKNWTDKQIKNYILMQMISKPTFADKLIANPSLIVKGKNQIQTPDEIIGNVIDLQKKGLWAKVDSKRLKQILKTMPAQIAIGIGEALYEVLVKFPKEAIVSSFNYGKGLVKRAKKERTRTIKILMKDILKVNKGIYETRKFVQERPRETAIIVGFAISTGLDAASKEANKNPGKFFGKAVTHIMAIPERLALKGFKATGAIRVLEEAKFIARQPKEIKPFVREIIKGAKFQEKLSPTNVKKLKKINFNEVKELNKIEAKALEKTLRETDSFIFGSLPSRAISKGRTPIPKDVDLATKNKTEFFEKFIKNLPEKTKKNYIVKGEKIITKDGRAILDVKGYDRLRPNQSIFSRGQLPVFEQVSRKALIIRIKTALGKIKPGKKAILREAELKIPVQKLEDIKGIKLVGFGEQTTRKALGTLQVIIEKEARRAKDPAAFISSLKIQLEALKGNIPKSFIKKTFKKYTINKLEKSIKILESKKFANLLEKKVPGLIKEYPILSKLKTTSKIKINNKFKKQINLIKNKIKKKLLKKKIIKLQAKKKIKLLKKIRKSKIRKSKIRKSKIRKPSKLKPSKLKPSKLKPSKLKPSKLKPSKLKPSKLKPSKLKPSKLKPSKLKPSKLKPSKLKPSKLKPSKLKPSKLKPSKLKPSKLKPSKLKPSKPWRTPPPRPPLPSLAFDSKAYSNKVMIYQAIFRERANRSKPFNKRTNPVVTKKINYIDTRNRVVKKIAELADRRTVRSIEVSIKGTTNRKKKDIKRPTILKKFNIKKSKGSPVLKLVEQSKYISDTPGEKKELKITRKQKKTSPRKNTKVSKYKKK